MQENTNQAIAYNTVVLYGRMLICTVCALLTTRFALKALGLIDYGLFAVLGGIISIIAIFNTIMLSTSNRFIAVAIGKGDVDEVNKQFNVNLLVHSSIAVFALAIAVPVGEWYIPRFINYEGPTSRAFMVYLISVAGSILSFIGVPYNGVLMAKERFIVFSLVDALTHVIKMAFAWLLISHFDQKLLLYTIMMAVLTAAPTAIFIFYCKRHFYSIVRFRYIRDWKAYKKVFSFSAWVGVGAVANIAKTQGSALLVNAFFNTIMNAALGVATSISTYINLFASAFIQPMQPQMTKSYAAGNTKRTDELLIMSTKYSFLLTLLIGSVFLVDPAWLLSLWLGKVPPHAPLFLVLLVIDQLIQSFNAGIGNIIWASGRISVYQLLTSSLNVLAVVAGFFVLRGGAAAYYLFVTYIIFSVVRFFAIQWALHSILNYNNKLLWRHSYLPALCSVFLFLFVFCIPRTLHPGLRIIISFFYLCVVEWFVGFKKSERERIISFIRRTIQ